MNQSFFKLLIAVNVLALLFSCGGGGSSAVTAKIINTTTPYIYAELNSFSDTEQSSARVEVLEDSTNKSIVDANVVLNNVVLPYNSNDQAYEGHVTIHPGEAVSLIVTVGTDTYEARGAQFTSYPTISDPQAGSTWVTGIDNTVTWTIGPLNNLPTTYGLGIVDADNPDARLVWPPDNYLMLISVGDRSYSVPAYTLTPGNRLVMVGISSFIPISGGSLFSKLIISGFQYTPITVAAATLSSISITPANPIIPKGTDQQFRVTGTFSDNRLLDMTAKATWESSALSNVIVATSGLARGIGVGSSIITASLNGFSDTTTLTVTPAVLESISIGPLNATIDPGTTCQFWAEGTYSDGSSKDLTTIVTWSSSDEGIAAISNDVGSNGKASADASGTTTITASLGDVSATATLTVARLISIAVTPATPSTPTITKGSQRQFIATGTYSDNKTQDITDAVIWNSSNNEVATISNAAGSQGNVTSVSSGITTISADVDGIIGSTLLSVSIWKAQAATNHYAVVWNGSQFVAVGGDYPGSGSSILTSPDGLTWTKQNPGIDYTLYDVVWSGSQFVAVGGHGSIITSPDAITWTVQSSGTTLTLSGVVWSGTQFVAVGSVGIVLYSNDGITWASQKVDSSNNSLYGITYSGSQFVAVGLNGSIYTSTDGTDWTSRSSASGNFFKVFWSGTQYIMIGSQAGMGGWSGVIYTSSDGVTWINRVTGADLSLYGIGLCNDQIMAVGYNGAIQTSSDGVTWTSNPAGTWSWLSGIACSGSESVIVGNELILTNP